MDRGTWWATVHAVAKSWTRLSDFIFTFFHGYQRVREVGRHQLGDWYWRIHTTVYKIEGFSLVTYFTYSKCQYVLVNLPTDPFPPYSPVTMSLSLQLCPYCFINEFSGTLFFRFYVQVLSYICLSLTHFTQYDTSPYASIVCTSYLFAWNSLSQFTTWVILSLPAHAQNAIALSVSKDNINNKNRAPPESSSPVCSEFSSAPKELGFRCSMGSHGEGPVTSLISITGASLTSFIFSLPHLA